MATILYAEDDDAMRKFFEKALEKAGHHVMRVPMVTEPYGP